MLPEQNARELLDRLCRGEEYTLTLDGRTYLLYSWLQCDGCILNAAAEDGTVVWQAAAPDRAACAEALLAALREGHLD